MRLLRLLFLPLLIACHATQAQHFPEIRITVSGTQLEQLLSSKGEKMTLKDPVLSFNGQKVQVKEIHSRGNNSLTFPHKSLAVDLSSPVSFQVEDETVSLKKFDLLNLVMDKNLWHNRWAFIQMNRLGIFNLINSFCTLWINGQPQGIYLLVEKPSAFITRIGSPYMLRRGVNHSIDDEYFDETAKAQAKKHRQAYLDIYSSTGKSKAQALREALDAHIDSEKYFRWLAFNYLIMNGDYADEVFFFISPESGKFAVLPWDYDDILRPTPHEGAAARNAVPEFKSKLMFSSEDPLDRAIAADAEIYQRYVEEFKRTLALVTPELIESVAAKVKSELEVISQQAAVAEASLFLGKEKFEFSKAASDIQTSVAFVVNRRNALLK